MKKIIKIVLTLVAGLVGILLLCPYFLHEKLEAIAKEELKSRIAGTVDFDHLDISFFTHFPEATVSLEELYITSSNLPNDTLLQVPRAEIVLDSYEYLVEGHIDMKSVKLVNPKIDAHIDYFGATNFAILAQDTITSDSSKTDMRLHLEKIEMENGTFSYHDVFTQTSAEFTNLSFTGTGEISDKEFDLTLDANAGSVSLLYGGNNYFKEKTVALNFDLGVDLLRNIYTIKKGDIRINEFPISVRGKIEDVSTRYKVDIDFNSPKSSFENLLSLFKFLQQNLDSIDAVGNIAFNGSVRGDYVPSTDTIPKFDIKLEVKDGSFKIDTLEDSIRDIHFDFMVSNHVGLMDSTEFELDSIFFRIKEHAVQGHAHVHRLVNAMVDAEFTGSLHVEEILSVYPIPNLQAQGQLNFNFMVEGNYSKVDANMQLPHIDFDIDISRGKIKYDTLPDSLSNIFFHMGGHSPQGNWRSGKISVEHLRLNLADDPVEGKLTVENFDRPNIDAFLKGEIHLEDILRVFPLDSTELRGKISTALHVNGLYDPAHGAFPKVSGNVAVENAFIKLPDIEDALEDVSVKTRIENLTGKIESTRLDISQFKFKLDKHDFEGSGVVTDFKDFGYDLKINGGVDLKKITQYYPLEDMSLSGEVTCDLELAGKISDLRQGFYERTKASGTVHFTNLIIDNRKLPETISVAAGKLRISPETIFLEDVRVRSGSSRLSLEGEMKDYFCFFKDDGDLVTANLNLTADTINLNEWKPAFVTLDRGNASLTQQSATTASAWQVPSTVDFNFNSHVKLVEYEDMHLENLNGNVRIRDGVMSVSETGFNSLNAKFAANGTYDSRDIQHPMFNFALRVDELDIKKAYKELQLVRTLLPAAGDAEGMFSIDYKLAGELDDAMSPKMPTLKGGGIMHIAEAKIHGMKMFERLSKAAKKKEMDDPHLRDFTMTTEIRDNKVFVKPFSLKVAGFNTEIEGVNDLKGTVNYVVKVQLLPLNTLRIPFNVSGTYDDPKVALGKGHKLPEETATN